jgi:hypothetical protein
MTMDAQLQLDLPATATNQALLLHKQANTAAPASGKRDRLHPPVRKTLGSSHKPAPPAAAPRGDLFREQAEKERAAATIAKPDMHTPEEDRARFYDRLADSASDVFRGKRKLKGPIECLRRNTTSNRRADFDGWLRRLGLKGASMEVRYGSLLETINCEIDEIATDLRYTDADRYGTNGWCDPTKDVRSSLARARLDVAELPTLFRGMNMLMYYLKAAKRNAACPPPPPAPPSEEERRQWREREAMEARATRVEESRKWLREMSEKEKHSDTDVRSRTRWISLDGIVMMVRDDLHGYGNVTPLWSSVPSPDQLAKDYGISRQEAARVLASYSQSLAEPGRT